MKQYYVYIHRCKINNKVYVGITGDKPENRWGRNGYMYTRIGKNGRPNQPEFANAIKKYGWNNFTHTVLLTVPSKEIAEAVEIELIAKLKACNHKYGYNHQAGGNLVNYTIEDRISRQAVKRKVLCVTTGEIFPTISIAAETYNICKTSVAKCCRHEQSTANGMQFCFLGDVPSDVAKGHKTTIRCITTGEVFESYTSAANAYNIDLSYLRECIKNNHKAKGLIFEKL